METRARFTVDADHCQRAADELYEIFRVQHRGFVERWHAARTTRIAIGVLRWVGLILCLLALFAIGALLYFDTREWATQDRKSTRLNSSHMSISYAVFC